MISLFKEYIVLDNATIIEALSKIDSNQQGFVIVTNIQGIVLGVLTDGDVRRAIIKGQTANNTITNIYTRNAKKVSIHDEFGIIIELFKNQSIKFIPIVDEEGKLANIITRDQMHTLLLQDVQADLTYDFLSLDTSVVDHEIFQRPWGYYKTTVLNDYFQAKIISVKPGGQLSLQSHNHREEHWIVVHGEGTVQLDKSIVNVHCGSTIFIPLGCKHRLTNTDKKESLIITEVQIGDYFGEDDIIRYEDIYGRIKII
ncbi:MAG: CBS domain-containing protein [Salinivirgaceae bacterium]|nr:CBS domain-containing protein [Salinivirgaceae bacterium]